jgi:hypothetical protein
VAEELLDFPKILSDVVKEDCGRGMPQPVGSNLPHPERSARRPKPQLNARLEKGAPEYPAYTNCDPANAIPPEAMIRRALNLS